MKRLFSYIGSALITLCFSFHSYSQSYFPMPELSASWSINRCFAFYGAGVYDRITISINGEDTELNATSYKKLLYTFHHAPGTPFDTTYTLFAGGIRESAKKVYIVSPYLTLDTTERLIYDFNANEVGDTVYTEVINYAPAVSYTRIVTAIDSVQVGSSFHRRLSLTDPLNISSEDWIEGIGSNFGLIYAGFWINSDNSYTLICFNQDDSLQYQNPSVGFNFCTPPLPPVTCDSLATSVPEKNSAAIFEVFPQLVTDAVHLKWLFSNSGNYTFEIADIRGKVLASIYENNSTANNFTVDFSSYPAGMYFISAFDSGRKLKTLKVMKGN